MNSVIEYFDGLVNENEVLGAVCAVYKGEKEIFRFATGYCNAERTKPPCVHDETDHGGCGNRQTATSENDCGRWRLFQLGFGRSRFGKTGRTSTLARRQFRLERRVWYTFLDRAENGNIGGIDAECKGRTRRG